MKSTHDKTNDITPINPIRIETALSRFPIHRLAKHGDFTIDIKEQSENGEVLIRWEISHNSKYGQPGPLAYKIDTIIINRRIEEAPRPIPRIIRLGSLNREIPEELGVSTHATKKIKNALHQNASAYITAKTRYRQSSNGKLHDVEIGDTRYAVVFTGEQLPDGRTADAVYIVLHDFYRKILDEALTRPLDYDYLKDLAPTAQRLYELLSYHVYAALKHDRARAKLIYSEFCTYAPQTRYTEFDKVKKQMYKINSVHKKSGYIAKVDFHQTTDAEGRPDWIMLYMPGLKARAEFQAFGKRTDAKTPLIGLSPSDQDNQPAQQEQLDLKLTPPRKSRSKTKQQPLPSPLIAELVQRGVTEEWAVKLVQQHPERIALQIEFLEWEMVKKPGKIADPAAYLVKAIERNNAPPKGFILKAEREQQAEAKRQKEEAAAASRRRQQENYTASAANRSAILAYRNQLTNGQLAEMEAKALAAASEEVRESLEKPSHPGVKKRLYEETVDSYILSLLQQQEEPA